MHLSFIKNKLLTLFAAIGVIITLLPFSLEAGILGQWCSDENNLKDYRYRCGSFWQALKCNSYYDKRSQDCKDRDYSCCNPSNKSSEKPYDVELPEKEEVGADVVKALKEIEHGLPRPNVRKSKPFENDGRDGTKRLPKEDENGDSISYTEHTVNPKKDGVLDGQRIMEGSDGSMWYTPNHMYDWIKLK